jgi:DNA-directed RNA polymerase subunit RPC12/RpoP
MKVSSDEVYVYRCPNCGEEIELSSKYDCSVWCNECGEEIERG